MMKILVVDDSSNERNGLCRLLERAGYEVRSAADGVEALEKIRENQFDLLLVDIWMPRMNGIELSGPSAGRFAAARFSDHGR